MTDAGLLTSEWHGGMTPLATGWEKRTPSDAEKPTTTDGGNSMTLDADSSSAIIAGNMGRIAAAVATRSTSSMRKELSFPDEMLSTGSEIRGWISMLLITQLKPSQSRLRRND